MLALYLFVAATASALSAALLEFLRTRQGRHRVLILALFATSYTAMLVLSIENAWLINLAVLLLGTAIGSLLSSTIASKAALWAFLISASLIDLLSFSGGLTRRILEAAENGNSAILSFLTISLSVEGSTRYVLGIGDLAIFGAVYLALRNLGQGRAIAFVAPLLGLSAAIVWGSFAGGVSAIPFIAVTTLASLAFRDRQVPA